MMNHYTKQASLQNESESLSFILRNSIFQLENLLETERILTLKKQNTPFVQ